MTTKIKTITGEFPSLALFVTFLQQFLIGNFTHRQKRKKKLANSKQDFEKGILRLIIYTRYNGEKETKQ